MLFENVSTHNQASNHGSPKNIGIVFPFTQYTEKKNKTLADIQTQMNWVILTWFSAQILYICVAALEINITDYCVKDEMSTFKLVAEKWNEISLNLNLAESKRLEVWEVINTRYSEPQRYYHTLKHIEHMLTLTSQYSDKIKYMTVVNLAVIFHDIIYNPQSATNEADSTELFESLLKADIDESLNTKVVDYIIQTKEHKVQFSLDSDLQYFIDIDMFILGTERPAYTEYCRNIRKEYIFVPEAVYCEKRGAFLRNLLNSGEKVFATADIGELQGGEQRARDNMEWECGELEAGRLI